MGLQSLQVSPEALQPGRLGCRAPATSPHTRAAWKKVIGQGKKLEVMVYYENLLTAGGWSPKMKMDLSTKEATRIKSRHISSYWKSKVINS